MVEAVSASVSVAELVEARPSLPTARTPDAGASFVTGSVAPGSGSGGSPEVSTEMIGVPTATVAPSSTRIASTTPSNGDGSSTSDFAVSISTITWFTDTGSPGATFHETISASVRPSPASGSKNSEVVTVRPYSVGHGPVDGLEHPVGVGKVGGLQLRWGEGGIEAADAQHGGLEREERTL